MAITISGENNNDKILASDGVIDQISGINIVGLITASHINVGSNIQLGNAGIITATTFNGNLTGNVNSTSPLLLQTGGSERFRITGNNELGIAGANYGSAGQVLTSGGSGSAVTWSAIPSQVNITNNADNRVITGGSGVNLNGEANLTYDGTNLQLQTDANNEGIKLNSTLSGGSSYPVFEMEANRGVGNTLGKLVQKWNGTQVASIQFSSGSDGTNKDDAHIHFNTASAGTVIERMKITSTGAVGINTTSPGRRLHVYGGFGAANLGHPLILERGDNSNTQIEVRSGGEIRGLWGASSTANFMVYDNDASDIQFVVNQTGDVGIGDASPPNFTGYRSLSIHGSTGGALVFGDDGTDEWEIYGGDGVLKLYDRANTIERLRIDSSGHMGLGVTPNANWPTNNDFKALQIGTGACLFGRGSGDEDRGGIAVNWYSTGNANKYIGNGNAARIYLADGNIYFSNAGANSSGANAAMTLEDKMILDSNGNLNIGAAGSGNASVYARNILISGPSNNGITIHTTDTSGSNRKCCIFFGTGTSVADMADGMLFYDNAGQYFHMSTAGGGTGVTKSSMRLSSDGTVRFDSTPTTTNSISLLIKSHKSRAENDNNGILFRDAADHSQAAINVTKRSNINAASELVFRTSDGAVTTTIQGVPERLRIGRTGQIGIAGANYGEARQTIVSGGASASVSWSSNPFLLDMAGLGDIDYDGVFLRYREVNVSGNGIVHLGLCKSTTNCPAGRIGCPVGFIPGVAYNSQFRVDKVGITPWPAGSNRYEYFAVISDYVSAGKLGIFYLTNSTN